MGNMGQEKASTSVSHGSAFQEGFGNNCVKQKKRTLAWIRSFSAE